MSELAVSVLCVVLLVLFLWVRVASARLARHGDNLEGLRVVINKMNQTRKDDRYVTGSCGKVTSLILTKLQILNHVADIERNH